MTDFSIKEAEMLCFKAARGAGYSWGMAEEAGFAMGWLAKYGLTDLSEFVSHLLFVESRNLWELSPLHPDDGWVSASGVLCPIITGSFLSDCCAAINWNKSVVVGNLARPLLLLPFASNVSMATAQPIVAVTSEYEAIVDSGGTTISKRTDPQVGNPLGQAKLTKAATAPRTNTSPKNRIVVPAAALNVLNRFAAKTYVPETKELMLSGAGGKNVDDDD